MYSPSSGTTLLSAVVIVLASLATAAVAASSSDANALLPRSVTPSGELEPVSGIAKAITGKTVVIEQPWVGRKSFEIRQTPVYFRADGYADSPAWVDIPWTVRGSEVCMSGNGVSNCYTAYRDTTRQAYLMDRSTNLLAKVKSIRTGDTHDVRAAYQARLRQEAAEQAMQLAFVGLLAEALLSGGGGKSGRNGGSTHEWVCPNGDPPPCYEEPEPTYAPPDTSVGCAWGDRAYGTCQ